MAQLRPADAGRRAREGRPRRFWTYTCINWLRTLPYIRAWSRKYRDDGLIVVGVHTPEFEFERDVDNVRRETAARDIDYPVAIDSDYAIWDAFANHYWPALYFVDREGVIRDHHFGEGRYEQSERVIQQLLGVERELVSIEGAELEAPADWADLDSPETISATSAARPAPVSSLHCCGATSGRCRVTGHPGRRA